jgi:nitrogen fixation protein NifB
VEKVESYVGAALEKCGALSVVGVAGPGDSLVGDNLFRSFEIVGRKYPRLLKCASTNGLLLPSRAKELLKVGVDTLTVTVNAVDPGVLAKIVLRVRCDGREYEGREGAEILIENQLAGIRKMTSAGVAVKVNTVLIPGVNDHHVADVARAAGEAGAALFNIIPLIPQHRMADLPAPGCGELEAARRQAGAYIDVFRHCQHCRADAFGIPGVSELSGALGPGRAEEVFSHG